jgi:mannopine transport system permease protein
VPAKFVPPLCLPGITAGIVLVFVIALGFFIIPALVGGPQSQMIASLIGRQITSAMNWPLAAAMSVVLLAVTIAILAGFNKVLRFDRRFVTHA